jgi:hypothetical protein
MLTLPVLLSTDAYLPPGCWSRAGLYPLPFPKNSRLWCKITVKCMICLGKWFSKLYAARTAVQIAGMVTGFPASFSG